MKYQSSSAEETKKIAFNLAKEIKSGIIALTGDLGAGKTTFTQGFTQGLGIKDRIISPTFVLIRQHKIPKTRRMLFHIDLYRLDNPDHVRNLGIEELLQTKDDIVLIEWAEKIESLLPKNTTKISIKIKGENSREIFLSGFQ